MKLNLLSTILVAVVFGTSFVVGEEKEPVVTVVPEETDEILANPGMGWETFHRTSKAGQEPALLDSLDRPLRPLGLAGIGARSRARSTTISWTGCSKETHESGQKLAFRVMCCSPYKGQPYHPEWLKEIGGQDTRCRPQRSGAACRSRTWTIRSSSNAHLDFIKRLGERYDGHPDIDHVDLGSIGWWGEWHMSGIEERQDADAGKPEEGRGCLPGGLQEDAARDAHRRQGMPQVRHAARNGLAGRLPGRHGRVFHDLVPHAKGLPDMDSARRRSQDAWKTAPVAWETCCGHAGVGGRGMAAAVDLQLRLGLPRLVISATSRRRCPTGRMSGPKWSGSCGGWDTGWCSRN